MGLCRFRVPTWMAPGRIKWLVLLLLARMFDNLAGNLGKLVCLNGPAHSHCQWRFALSTYAVWRDMGQGTFRLNVSAGEQIVT